MLTESSSSPPRIPLTLQRSQVLVEARPDRIRRHVQLVRCVTIVRDKLRRRCRWDGTSNLEFRDCRYDRSFDRAFRKGGGGAELEILEACDIGGAKREEAIDAGFC